MSQVNYYQKRAIAHLCPAPLCHRSHNPIGKNDKELNPDDVEGPNITAQKKRMTWKHATQKLWKNSIDSSTLAIVTYVTQLLKPLELK